MSKPTRPSLFGTKPAVASAPVLEDQGEVDASARPTPAGREPITASRYPKAATREGKRAITAYVSPETFRSLKRIAADEDAQQQDLLIEALNLLFEKRGLSRIA